MTEYERGLRDAIEEIRGWRELTVKAFREFPCVDPKEAARECRNKLNLLGVIESKLRHKAGDDPKVIFREDIERSKSEGVEY